MMDGILLHYYSFFELYLNDLAHYSTVVSLTLLQLGSSSNSCNNYNKAVFRPNRTVKKKTQPFYSFY